MRVRRTSKERCALLLTLALVSSVPGFSQPRDPDTVTVLGTTVPGNGDVNPYGVALVPRTIGKLVEGRFLVSNFNGSGGLQGTGTTIVQMTPGGSQTLFAQIDPTNPKVAGCKAGGGASGPLTVGLTTALVALRSGFVVVGSLPTSDGMSDSVQPGCLIVLDSQGNVVEAITGHHINGPWDMTAVDGEGVFVLFVTNVLNDTVAGGGANVNEGSVVRYLFAIPPNGNPKLLSETVIADKFPERTDPNALVIGPTGVAYDGLTGNLLVADSIDNKIVAIPNALFRAGEDDSPSTVSSGGALNDPLGVSLLGRDLYVANGDDGKIVEINVDTGKQIDADLVDSSGGPPPPPLGFGALFGLWAVDGKIYFVDDATNMWEVLH